MTNKSTIQWSLQRRALRSHLTHELKRMFRIPMQAFLPAVITTLLYFLIFGEIIGKRVGRIDNIPYSLFIFPGLVMLAVITNAYINAASSLFSARFQRCIEELLISPMHPIILLSGYILGSVLRGLIVCFLVLLVAVFFIDLYWSRLWMMLLLVTLFSILFALAGFLNGMIARNFEDISIVPTFILSPLTYLGGIFYSIDMLPHFWKQVAQFNPIVYMIHLLRFAMLNQPYPQKYWALGIVISLTLGLGLLTLHCLKKGVGIRS